MEPGMGMLLPRQRQTVDFRHPGMPVSTCVVLRMLKRRKFHHARWMSLPAYLLFHCHSFYQHHNYLSRRVSGVLPPMPTTRRTDSEPLGDGAPALPERALISFPVHSEAQKAISTRIARPAVNSDFGLSVGCRVQHWSLASAAIADFIPKCVS